ncbi:hypothetical protein C5E45_20310 [Nocardia nova]|uniref:Restriction endonuclease n=1 Tax=Nocardia nova TaxID=37330 RepID=A0A2S6AMD4_9NOCA|nr:hypothetical protein [Nocardia nova]PPJ36395.1 hypothetical protein C5E45_20310 [Nocardia nova]
MALRRGRPFSAELEALDFFAQLELPEPGETSTVDDRTRRTSAHAQFATALDTSLDNKRRLHGWRTQALFEAVVLALGSVKMIKREDTGGFHFDDANGEINPPDFRVVTAEGEQLLVEVKNVAPKDVTRPCKLRRQDVLAHRRYAEMNGARLVFAHYWAGFKLWTLVDAAHLEERGNRFLLPITTAGLVNEFGALGDAMVGTRPPLTCALYAEPAAPQIRPAADHTQRVPFTVSRAEFAAAGQVLTDPAQIRIAQVLMFLGDWEMRAEDDVLDGQIIGTVFTAEPPMGDPEASAQIAAQGFAMVGMLSTMYSRWFELATLTEAGEVMALRNDPHPGVLRDLIPADYWERAGDALPIWKFHQVPNTGDE